MTRIFSHVFFLALWIVYSAQSFAIEHEVGNGGDAVVCRSASGIDSAVLYDFKEAKFRWNLIPNFGDNTLSVMDKVNLVLNRFATVDFGKAQEYLAVAKSFEHIQDVVSFTEPGTDLPDINDTGSIVPIAHGCQIEQAAIQRPPEFPNDKKYVISSDIWEKLDNDSRAGLILHEIIYSDALAQGHTDSRRTRYFHALLFSGEIEKYKLPSLYRNLMDKYINLRGNEKSTFIFNQFKLHYSTIKTGSDGSFSAAMADKSEIDIFGTKAMINDLVLYDGSRVGPRQVEFYSNGQPKILSLRFKTEISINNYRFSPTEEDAYEGVVRPNEDKYYSFADDGHVKNLWGNFKINFQNQWVRVSGFGVGNNDVFDQVGQLKGEVFFDTPFELTSLQGVKFQFDRGIVIFEQGVVHRLENFKSGVFGDLKISGGSLEFFDDGSYKIGTVDMISQPCGDQPVTLKGSKEIEVRSDHVIRNIEFGDAGYICVQNRAIELHYSWKSVEFYPGLIPREVVLNEDAQLKEATGKDIYIPKKSRIKFDEKGFVTQVTAP